MSAKGYGGFNRIPMQGASGTVIAGKHEVESDQLDYVYTSRSVVDGSFAA